MQLINLMVPLDYGLRQKAPPFSPRTLQESLRSTSFPFFETVLRTRFLFFPMYEIGLFIII
jgi:hypothetical protein